MQHHLGEDAFFLRLMEHMSEIIPIERQAVKLDFKISRIRNTAQKARKISNPFLHTTIVHVFEEFVIFFDFIAIQLDLCFQLVRIVLDKNLCHA